MKFLNLFLLAVLLQSPVFAGEKVNYRITAPEVVDNGLVVPFWVDFNPALKQGDDFKIKINGLPLAEVSINKGTLSQFSFRTLMFSDPGEISIECKGCVGQSFKAKVNRVASISNSDAQVSVKEIKGLAKNGEVKFIIFYDSPNPINQPGLITITGDSFSSSTKMSNLSVFNPFVGIQGSISSGKYCLTFKNQFESTQCVSF